jgi:peptide/nickel transport system ATP-binding protein
MAEADGPATQRAPQSSEHPLVQIRGLTKYYPVTTGFFSRVKGTVRAVDGVTLTINEGETVGLVGESGCGKTTLSRCLVRAVEPTDGTIAYRLKDGRTVDIASLPPRDLKPVRREIHMVFQDPYSSLDPRMTVLDIIGEPIKLHKLAARRELIERVKYLMDVVGLDVKHLKRYPHAFSGGQRQRIGIARSLALNPRLIVCDEAVSALDVSVQAQILNLLKDLQEQFDLTYLFVAHDLAVVQHISNKVAVMYVGKLVELAETQELYLHPLHPYTEALLSAIPTTNPHVTMERKLLRGEIANPADPPSGCYFHPRCEYAQPICSRVEPALEEAAPGRFCACHRARELKLAGVE